ncbi:MAG: sigma-70 family RNA polymerase sigma factor [Bacteroidetes bacterium]|nr:sigma-70 family RNA polymerase sigma factor [Bacteroidota bacterium]
MEDFKEIYEQYWSRVYRLCMGYLNDPAHAQDVAQETFVTVWEKLPQFRGESAIGTWIFRIASNQCLRQIARDKRMPRSAMPTEVEEKTEAAPEGKIAYLYKAISELPETDRIIISLELEGLPQAEIAVVVGISEGNVRVKIHRIKDKLTQKFKQYDRQ